MGVEDGSSGVTGCQFLTSNLRASCILRGSQPVAGFLRYRPIGLRVQQGVSPCWLRIVLEPPPRSVRSGVRRGTLAAYWGVKVIGVRSASHRPSECKGFLSEAIGPAVRRPLGRQLVACRMPTLVTSRGVHRDSVNSRHAAMLH